MKAVRFPRWAEVLKDAEMHELDRECFLVTIRWYLSWCRKCGVGCDFDSARNFVEWARAEKNAEAWVVERWQKGLNWFFRHAKAQVAGEGGRSGIDPSGGTAAAAAVLDGGRGNRDEVPIGAVTSGEMRILEVMRRRGMALRTERAYLSWYRDFVRQGMLDTEGKISAAGVKSYLNYLAMERRVASSTQRTALNALVFIAQKAFSIDLGDIGGFVKARNFKRIPVVLSRDEVRAIFAKLSDDKLLMAQVQYAAGLRISELLRLRVKDLDLERNQVIVRSGKGGKDRVAPLSDRLGGCLRGHLESIRAVFDEDRNRGLDGVFIPEALERKHRNAGKEWLWQWVWPSRETSIDPRSGLTRRHHVMDRAYQMLLKKAGASAGISKRVTSHTFRHSFATHLLESGVDIRTVQDLLGHKQIETTQVYLHVMQKPGVGVVSPLDSL